MIDPEEVSTTIERDPIHTTEYVTAWAAPSSRHAHVTYRTTYDRLTNEWRCNCPGFTYRAHCSHVDAAMDDLVAQWREAMTGERTTRGAA